MFKQKGYNLDKKNTGQLCLMTNLNFIKFQNCNLFFATDEHADGRTSPNQYAPSTFSKWGGGGIKIPPNIPKTGNWLAPLIRLGKSIRLKIHVVVLFCC